MNQTNASEAHKPNLVNFPDAVEADKLRMAHYFVEKAQISLSEEQSQTPYRSCLNDIFLSIKKGYGYTTCTNSLTDDDCRKLRANGYKVRPIFFPWKYENDLYDPKTGNRAGYSVHWD